MPELGSDGTRIDHSRTTDGTVLDLDARPIRPGTPAPGAPATAPTAAVATKRAAAAPAVGKPRGNKQEVPLHVPRASFEALAAYADGERVSRGVAVMRALRAVHSDLARDLAPSRADDGPFPAERRSRRRIRVDQAVRTSVLVWPDEAAALSRVADDLDLSCSELVTLAIDRHLAVAADPAD
jgi:hypothetical protein